MSDSLKAKDYDLWSLARQLVKKRNKPALRIDCGVDDYLIDSNRLFRAHLEKLGVAHQYAEHPGDHNWEYWDKHITDTLAFVMKNLNTK